MGMEGGGYFSKLERQKQAKLAPASAEPESEEKEQELTIQEIRDQEGKPFGEYLGSQHDPKLVELGARLKTGDITEQDIPLIMKQRHGYLEQKSRSEKLVGTLKNYVDDLKVRSEKFRQFTEAFGEENVLNLLDKGLREMAMNDPKGFAAIEKKDRALEEFKEKVEKPLEKRITDFCTKHNLTEGELLKAMEEDDPVKRQKNVQLLMHHKLGTTWNRFKDDFKNFASKHVMLQAGTRMASLAMSNDKVYQDQMLLVREKLLKSAGDGLAALITKNPALRQALVNMQNGGEPSINNGIESKTDMSELVSNGLTTRNVRAQWEQFLTDQGVTDFGNEHPGYQDVLKNRFGKEFAKKAVGDKRGFWASVWEFMFSTKLKNDPELQAQLT